MKQKSYDVQDLYRDYMQSVSADPTAIDDILSGERQPANTGAKIKHSTGKMATVTAAAAVIAVCAGIGLSNMNANDDSSIKPAANQATTTTAVTTSQQQKQQKTEDAEFKSEVTQMFASDHGLRVVVKSTALNVAAKSLIAEADKQLKENLHCGLSITPADQDTSRFAGGSISQPKIDGDSFTSEIIYEPNGITNIFTDGTKCTVRVTIPGEEYKLLKNTGVAEFTIKKNMTERVFKSASGKTMWLSDYQFNCDIDYTKITDKDSHVNFEIAFADGTVKTRQDTECVGGYSTKGTKNDPNTMIAFSTKLDSSKVTSIKYAGEVFTPYEQPAVTMTAEPIFVTERAFGINLKLTADNEAGRKVLEENASKIVTSIKIEKDGMIATAGLLFGNDKLDGNTLNLRLYGNIFNKRIETVPVEIALPMETPYEVVKALGGNTSTTVYFKKTTEDKVFVNSATGEKFWLSDLVATTDHNYRTQKSPPVTFKLSDGTELTAFYGGGNFGRGKINKQHSFFLENKIDVSKVVSITYDGETFTAQ